MQRPDLPSRIAHALRPEDRARQDADQRRIEALLISSGHGELLSTAIQHRHMAGMLREIAAQSGIITTGAAPSDASVSRAQCEATGDKVARAIHAWRKTPNTLAGGEADREEADDIMAMLAAHGLAVVESDANG